MSQLSSDHKTPAAIERDAYIWNTAGSLLNAFQSVILLMVLTRATTMEEAGIFTLAYANANLFLNMGKYGMRNFQASDVEPQYSFSAYLRSRVITTAAMIVCSGIFLLVSATSLTYSAEKIWAIALMCLFKAVDSVEDIYQGSYQQHGRLDVGARLLTWRTALTILVFAVLVALTHTLVMPLAVATVFNCVYLAWYIARVRQRYHMPYPDIEAASSSASELLKTCFPLFLAAFLLFYIGNAPKYAIDALMDDVAQANYGFIAMPVFVVGLLAQFVYMPKIEPLSKAWTEGDTRGFAHEFLIQSALVGAITLVCVAGAAWIGVPVLGALYNTDLSSYLAELCILVAGGGFLALASLFTMGITIMRKQRLLTWGYVAVAVVALLASEPAVRMAGIYGASVVYIGCMIVLAAWFGVLFAALIRRAR